MSKFSRWALPGVLLLSLACGETKTANPTSPRSLDASESPSDSGPSAVDSGNSITDAGTLPEDAGQGPVDTGMRAGTTPTSCGSENAGVTPVDCTEFGDVDAYCVFGDHCSCSVNAGFKCEGAADGTGSECSPGVVCVPKREDVSEAQVGSASSSCGDPMLQNLTPIDCTRYGDLNAQCVFSNHCACSETDGFECETQSGSGPSQECAAGVYCVSMN